MKRNLCIVTGSRAEFSLLKGVIELLREDKDLNLSLVATGMHLSPEFGSTFQEIIHDGFHIDYFVESLLSGDTPAMISKSIGLGIIGFSDAFKILKPDLVLVLGDRYEIFSASTAALVANIPIAHLYGGEVTRGSIDDAFRHSITKMAHLHFVSTDFYKNRIMQLGEDPDKVFVVGSLGVENINKVKKYSKLELQREIDFIFGERNLLVTYHPETTGFGSPKSQLKEMLLALSEFPDIHLIFTMPNADSGNAELIRLINEFVHQRENARFYKSLGQKKYFSCIQYVDGVLGNSSSGIIEVPSFLKGTINIGNRQQGRVQGATIINCNPEKEQVITSIKKLYSAQFHSTLKDAKSPYDGQDSACKIYRKLKQIDIGELQEKIFFDLKINN